MNMQTAATTSDDMQATQNHSMRVLTADECRAALTGARGEVVQAVADAYRAHGSEKTVAPHSSFLRFPENDRNRIIGLPAYLGASQPVAGMKWISSWPGNPANGIERASGVLILNGLETGRAFAMMECSTVSAQRTAASAALAARELAGDSRPERIGLIGCGPINDQTARFLAHTLPSANEWRLFDLSAERAGAAAASLAEELPGHEISLADSWSSVLNECDVVAIATTALEPWLDQIDDAARARIILHTSLRDMTADVILGANNVVDDRSHVLRERTSVDLAQQQAGNHDFIACSLPELLLGQADGALDPSKRTIVSPFGLGILDLAVGQVVYERATAAGLGTLVPAFF